LEPKRDGEYNMLYKNAKSSFFTNKYGTQRWESQLSYQIETYFKDIQFTLLGEICFMEGKNGDLYNLLSNKTNDQMLRFYIFDIASLSGVDLCSRPILERKEILLDLFQGFNSTSVLINPCRVVSDKEQLLDQHQEYVRVHGMEGSVVKNLDSTLLFGPCSWVKIKNKDQNVYPVISIDPVKERIEVIVTYCLPDGRACNRNVGVKASHNQKAQLKIGDGVIVEHQGILSAGGLRHPVYIGKENP
jgi:ATP-dependent DNA ligase